MGDNLPFVMLREDVYATDISVGRDYTCIIADIKDKRGRVMCWGHNIYGQLGYGDTIDRGNKENDMKNLDSVDLGSDNDARAIFISAGYGHTCVIIKTTTSSSTGSYTSSKNLLKCFGWNYYAQLGTGDTANRGDEPGQMGDHLPQIDLGTGRNPIVVGAGQLHTCVLLEANEMKCWGTNNYGQLGLGNIDQIGGKADEMGDKLPSVDFGIGLVAESIGIGSTHSCAILNNKKLKCWGNNGGQLGLGDHIERGNSPETIGEKLPFVDIGAGIIANQVLGGELHTCIVAESGNVKCFGGNGFGQLGLANDTSYSVGDKPDQMGDNLPFINFGKISKIQSISVGSSYNCVILADNEKSIKCFGDNRKGQLGLGSKVSYGLLFGTMGENLPVVSLGTFPTLPPSTTQSPSIQTNSPTVYVPEVVKDAEKFVCSQFLTIEKCESSNGKRSNSGGGKGIFDESDKYLSCPDSKYVCIWNRYDDIGNCICGDLSNRIIKEESSIQRPFLQSESETIWIFAAILAMIAVLVQRLKRQVEMQNYLATPRHQRQRTGSWTSRPPSISLSNIDVTVTPPRKQSSFGVGASAASMPNVLAGSAPAQTSNVSTGIPGSTLVHRLSGDGGKRTHSRARNLSRSDNF